MVLILLLSLSIRSSWASTNAYIHEISGLSDIDLFSGDILRHVLGQSFMSEVRPALLPADSPTDRESHRESHRSIVSPSIRPITSRDQPGLLIIADYDRTSNTPPERMICYFHACMPIPALNSSCVSLGSAFVRMSATISVVLHWTS